MLYVNSKSLWCATLSILLSCGAGIAQWNPSDTQKVDSTNYRFISLEFSGGIGGIGFGAGVLEPSYSCELGFQITYDAISKGAVSDQPEQGWYWLRKVDESDYRALSFFVLGGIPMNASKTFELIGGLGLYLHDHREEYVSSATGWNYTKIESTTLPWISGGFRYRPPDITKDHWYISLTSDPIMRIAVSVGILIDYPRFNRRYF